MARPRFFSVYIASVALLPLLIALALIVGQWARQSSWSESTSPLELASALLALLALRQVLTPANISSITLLDRILAAELAIILLVTLFVYLRTGPKEGIAREPITGADPDRLSSSSSNGEWRRSKGGIWVPDRWSEDRPKDADS
jgi:hypothetical protein